MKRAAFATKLILLVACGAGWCAYPMRLMDSRGREVTIPARPVRIVTLAPSITEVAFALGLEHRIVGVNSQSDFPPAARKKPKVGDVTISAEAVVALKPDLVLAHAFLNRSAIPRLEKLGLRVFAVDPKTIRGVIADIRTIGRLTARPLTAERAAKAMECEIAAQKAAAARRKPRNVLVVIQANPLWVAGPKTFVDEMLSIANARNVAADARAGFVTFSKELAIKRSPEIIIVGQPGDAQYLLNSPEWKNTRAVRSKQVHVVNNDLLVRPGPRLVEGLRVLGALLDRLAPGK